MIARAYISISVGITLALLIALPEISSAQLNQNGISGCNSTGAYAMSVGTMGSLGGSFVPVFDDAVTLNTGYLVYDACVLRPLIANFRQAATGAYTQQTLATFTTNRNGNPQFVQNYGQEFATVGNQTFNNNLRGTVSSLTSAFQSQIGTALARNYALTSTAPQNALACPYQGDPGAAGSSGSPYSELFAEANPTCDPVYAYYMSQDQLNAQVAFAQNAWQTQLNWGNGIYPVTNAQGLVVTPGVLEAGVALQAITSGYRQLENATDIGQMVGVLFAGVGAQILNNVNGGLAGLNTAQNGQPAYLDQVVQQTSSGLASQVVSAALITLNASLQAEESYQQSQSAMAGSLDDAIGQLQSAQNQCWQFIIQRVCSASSTPATNGGTETCTGTNGAKLYIATSTSGGPDFAQSVISSQIAPLADAVTQDASTSNQSLQAIATLIAGVQSPDAGTRNTALQQLDSLVAAGAFHTADDAQQAQSNASNVSSTMDTLVQNTVQSWTATAPSGAAFSASNSAGWCDVSDANNPATGPEVLNFWLQTWATPPAAPATTP